VLISVMEVLVILFEFVLQYENWANQSVMLYLSRKLVNRLSL
jgi:hypothetical protein